MFTIGPPLWGGASGDPYAGNVLALLHFNEANGTTIPTNSLGIGTISNGGASTNKVTSSSPKFGAGAWQASGSSGLVVNYSDVTDLDYTIEFFVKPTSFGSFGRFFGAYSTESGHDFSLSFAGGTLRYVDTSATDRVTTGAMTLNAWSHIAICYTSGGGSNVVVYLDGANVYSSSTLDRPLTGTQHICIGQSGAISGNDGACVFDEFRYSRGVNRYPSGLSVPTSEYPDS